MTSPVHPTAAEGFAAGAETYVRGRPSYPPEVLGWLRNTLKLQTGKTVVDLGAGTGKFTQHLLTTGATVIAVEPVEPMLGQLRQRVPGATALAGDAEHIPLAAGSIDAVVCAQSFHWFARESAIVEIRRVLKPGGVFGLIWNIQDDSVGWVAKLGRLLEPYEGDAPRFKNGAWSKLFPAPGFGPLHEVRFRHAHIGSPEHVIIDRVASISFVAALPPDRRARLLDDVRDLIQKTSALVQPGEVRFPYQTAAFHCVRD